MSQTHRPLRACIDIPSRAITHQELEDLILFFRKYTDKIESSEEEPGAFWLSTVGLEALYPSLELWAKEIRRELQTQHFQAHIVIGFTRFGSYALARSLRPDVLCLNHPQEELRLLQDLRLERLHLDHKFQRILGQLGIKTLGAFLMLPPDEIRTRLGAEAFRLYQLARGEFDLPVQNRAEQPVFECSFDFDCSESCKHRLLFSIKSLLGPLLKQIASESLLLQSLQLRFRFDDGRAHKTVIRPAEPTLDEVQIMDLTRLQLEAIKYTSGINRLQLSIHPKRVQSGQLSLFASTPKRDLKAADRALARIRAEWGKDAVVRAIIKDGHLPEAQFAWSPIQGISATPQRTNRHQVTTKLIRRIHQQPQRLPIQPRNTHNDGWLLRGLEDGAVIKLEGPYILNGGWWNKPIHREYHFAETQYGRLFWIYYDRQRRRWFLHGEVE